MTFSILVWSWILLVAAVLVLAAYRFAITRGNYLVLHVRRSETAQIAQQVIEAERLTKIDRWGSRLTAVTLGFGLVLAFVYLLSEATRS